MKKLSRTTAGVLMALCLFASAVSGTASAFGAGPDLEINTEENAGVSTSYVSENGISEYGQEAGLNSTYAQEVPDVIAETSDTEEINAETSAGSTDAAGNGASIINQSDSNQAAEGGSSALSGGGSASSGGSTEGTGVSFVSADDSSLLSDSSAAETGSGDDITVGESDDSTSDSEEVSVEEEELAIVETGKTLHEGQKWLAVRKVGSGSIYIDESCAEKIGPEDERYPSGLPGAAVVEEYAAELGNDVTTAGDVQDIENIPGEGDALSFEDMPISDDLRNSEYISVSEDGQITEPALTQTTEPARTRMVVKEAEYDYYLVESGALVRIDVVPDAGYFCSLFSAEELYGAYDSDILMWQEDAYYVSLSEQDSLITVWFTDAVAFQADNGDVAGIDELNVTNSSFPELVPVNYAGGNGAAEEVPEVIPDGSAFRLFSASPKSAAAGTNDMETTPVSWEYGSGIFHSVPYDGVIFGPGIGAEKQGFMATNFLTPDIPEYYRTVSAVSLPEAISSGSYIDMPASGCFMINGQNRVLTTRIYLWTNCVTDIQDGMNGTLSAVGTLYGSRNGSMFIYNQYSSLYPSNVYRYTCMAFYFYEAGTALAVDPYTFTASGAVDVNGYTFLNDIDFVDRWQIGAITDFGGNLLPTWHDTGSFSHKDPVISLYTTSASEVYALESGETYVGSTSNDNFSLDRGLGLTFRSGAADPLMLTYYVSGNGAVKTTFSAPTVRIKYHLIDSPNGEIPPADAVAPADKLVAYYANTAEENAYRYLFTNNYNSYAGYDFKGWFDLSAGHISSADGFSGSVSIERISESQGDYLAVTVYGVDFGASGHDTLRMELVCGGQSSTVQLQKVGQNTYSAVAGPDTVGAVTPGEAFTVNISSVMAADPFADKVRAVYSFDSMSQIVNSGLMRARTLSDLSAASGTLDFYDAGDGTITVSLRNVNFGNAGYDSIRLTAWNQANVAGMTTGIMTRVAEGLYQMQFYKNDPAFMGDSDVIFHFWFENSSTGASEMFTGEAFPGVDAIAGYSKINTASVTAGLGYLSLETYKGQSSQISDVDVFGYYTRGKAEGTVTIYKKDSLTKEDLEGALFRLEQYDSASGGYVPLSDLTDNKDGSYSASVSYSHSNKGKFRIVEEKAPEGYVAADLNERYFTLEYDGQTDFIFCISETGEPCVDGNIWYNSRQMTRLKINKTVPLGDLVIEHGEQSFVFEISGTDIKGDPVVYHRMISFADVKNVSTAGDAARGFTASEAAVGSVARSVILTDIPVGTYTVKEIKTDRYMLKDIEIISGNMTVATDGSGERYASGTIDAAGGEVTFFNEKTDWSDFSDTSSVVNHIGG